MLDFRQNVLALACSARMAGPDVSKGVPMQKKLALAAALAAFLAPGMAVAMCERGHQKVVAECGPGETRDAVSGQCVKPVSS